MCTHTHKTPRHKCTDSFALWTLSHKVPWHHSTPNNGPSVLRKLPDMPAFYILHFRPIACNSRFAICYRLPQKETQSLGKARDNWRTHHRAVVFINWLFLMFSHYRTSFLSVSDWSQPTSTYHWHQNAFQITTAYFWLQQCQSFELVSRNGLSLYYHLNWRGRNFGVVHSFVTD